MMMAMALTSNQPLIVPVMKIQPSVVVETVSDAIMRVLKQSTNMNFIENCCSNLKVTTLNEAENELKVQLWSLLRLRQGIISEELVENSNPFSQQNISGNKLSQVLCHHSPKYQNVLNRNPATYNESEFIKCNIDELEPDLLSLNSSTSCVTERSSCFDIMTNHPSENHTVCGCEPFFESDFNLPLDDSFTSIHVTSTPTEKNQQLINEVDNELDCLIFADPEWGVQNEMHESEVLRSTGTVEDVYCNWDVDCMNDSWENLQLSDVFSSPLATNSFLHFSKPECLDQSQLVGDITDLKDDIWEESSDVLRNQKSSFETDNEVLIRNESSTDGDSQNMIIKARSSLQEHLLIDPELFSYQLLDIDDENLLQESFSVGYRLTGENCQQTNIISASPFVEQQPFIHSSFCETDENIGCSNNAQVVRRDLNKNCDLIKTSSDPYIGFAVQNNEKNSISNEKYSELNTILSGSKSYHICSANENVEESRKLVQASDEDDLQVLFQSDSKQLITFNTDVDADSNGEIFEMYSNIPSLVKEADTFGDKMNYTEETNSNMTKNVDDKETNSPSVILNRSYEEAYTLKIDDSPFKSNEHPTEVIEICAALSQTNDLKDTQVLETSDRNSETSKYFASPKDCIEISKLNRDERLTMKSEKRSYNRDFIRGTKHFKGDFDMSFDIEDLEFDNYFDVNRKTPDITEEICSTSSENEHCGTTTDINEVETELDTDVKMSLEKYCFNEANNTGVTSSELRENKLTLSGSSSSSNEQLVYFKLDESDFIW